MRFPEFTDEWNEFKIGEICDVVGGGTPKTDDNSYWDGDIDWYTPSELSEHKYVYESKRKITKKGLDNSSAKLLPPKTILLSSRATIGETGIILKESTTNQGFQSLIVKRNLNYQFLYYLIDTIKKELIIRASGSTFLEISKDEIKKIKVNIPLKNEQIKIAKFISLIDQKIDLLEKKLVLWDKHLNYWINNLTTKNDKYNFHWKIFKFKDFLEEYNEKSKINNQYPLLSSTKDKIVLQENYFNKRIASKDNKGYKILHLNQLVLSPQNLWLGNININDEFEIGIVSPSYKIYNINKNLINQSYLKFIIKKPKMLYLYETVSEQGASVVRRNLNINLFMNLKIELPSINEQKIIGDFLLHLYNKNQLIKNKINILKIFKKGLLQKMFV